MFIIANFTTYLLGYQILSRILNDIVVEITYFFPCYQIALKCKLHSENYVDKLLNKPT
jgi:hypothetical protein